MSIHHLSLLNDHASGFVWTTDVLLEDATAVFSELFNFPSEGLRKPANPRGSTRLAASNARGSDEGSDEETEAYATEGEASDGTDNEAQNAIPPLDQIYRIAGFIKFYRQSALHLAKFCSLLVHSHLASKIREADLMKRFGQVMVEKSLERDLHRVLQLLIYLNDQDEAFFQDSKRFPSLFSYVLDYLLLDRPFLKFSEQEMNESKGQLKFLNDYDRRQIPNTFHEPVIVSNSPNPSGGPEGAIGTAVEPAHNANAKGTADTLAAVGGLRHRSPYVNGLHST